MPRLNLRIIICALLTMTLLGCAKVPPESVVLSDTIGKDLVVLQTVHNQLVRQYYASMRNNANTFVDEQYRPFIVRQTIEDLNLVKEFNDALNGRQQDGLDALDIMEIFAEETIAQIETFRSEMVTPINKQELQLLGEINQLYGAVKNANSTVTAHLRSIAKIHEAQSEVLGDLGLPADLRERISERTSGLAQDLNTLLVKAKESDKKFDSVITKVNDLFSND